MFRTALTLSVHTVGNSRPFDEMRHASRTREDSVEQVLER